MSSVVLLQIAAVLLVLTASGGVMLRGSNAKTDRMAARCRAVAERRTRSSKVRKARNRPKMGQIIGAFGSRFIRSGLLSQRTVKSLRTSLSNAGLSPDSALGLFVGAKVLLLICMPFLALMGANHFGLSSMTRNILVVIGAVGGLLLPDMVVKQMRGRHLARVERGLPDALDMLIICTEAGMAIEPAVLRVAQELAYAHPATAAELAWTSNELQVTGDPQKSFSNMGARTSLESLRRLGVTVTQTIQFGTPLSHALRMLATELRGEMIARFEEKAARLPVMLTVPMILFILPALFLVIGGPAAIHIFAMQHN